MALQIDTNRRGKKTVVDKRRSNASKRFDAWRKRNAKRLKGWDVVMAVRETRKHR